MAALRRHLSTVRGRSTWRSMAVVAVTLAVGAVVLLASFRSSLERNVDQTLQQQVRDRITLIDQGNDPTSFDQVLQEEAFVWIGRPDGTVISASGAVTPLENPIPSQVGTSTQVQLLVEERKPDEIDSEQMELRVFSAASADGTIIVVAGSEAEQIGKTLGELARLFALAIPAIVALVGALSWRTAGRALRPVEHIRAQAETITGASLAERVPVPDGTDEIHELAVTMNDMLARLESHERSLRQFTADASHELKSPVANVRALIDTTTIDDPAWHDLKATISSETDRLRDLVDNLLFLARRGEIDNQRGELTTVHLDDLLFDEAETLAAAHTIRVDIGGVRPAAVTGEREPLRRLVRNLVDNAARHTSTCVWLSCWEAENGTVLLTVSDDGAGISHDDRDRVFERFTRLEEARDRDNGGAGLGLAIVRQIAVDHGGDVAFVNSAHGGATVTAHLRSTV